MINGMYSDNSQDENFEKKSAGLNQLAQSKLQMLQRGSVTEITMGDRTFQVTDPKRIEQTISVLQHHEEALFTLRQRVKEHHTAINALIIEVEKLKNEVQRLKEITNGFGSNELSNY